MDAEIWVFRVVVFQDVGFQTNMLKPLTHISVRCEVPAPSVFERQSTIMFKPHILKHYIPELPERCVNNVHRCHARTRATVAFVRADAGHACVKPACIDFPYLLSSIDQRLLTLET